MEMITIRVLPDAKIQAAIVEAATVFEAKVIANLNKYHAIKATTARLIPTDRRIDLDISL
jgi:hypothetical protein